jgi:mannose-6-phosphate isomerase-like protein (cupin superfamily)
MTEVHRLEELRFSPTAWLFEGGKHEGAADVSCFVTATSPGEGPGLHVHPYPEVFYVREGLAVFTVGEEELPVAGPGFLVVPARTPHGFKNRGAGVLHVVSMHPSPEVEQRWLADD